MEYKKARPEISYLIFIKMVGPVAFFNSLEGEEYIVKKIVGSNLHFERKSTGKPWDMDLKEVLKAYKELKDFKTINFKPYVPLTHSPALGLLLHLGLLKR